MVTRRNEIKTEKDCAFFISQLFLNFKSQQHKNII